MKVAIASGKGGTGKTSVTGAFAALAENAVLADCDVDAAENSGKLVSTVREQAKQLATELEAEWTLIDGPPRTGCPVIASITGASAVLVVTEPTLSGEHDLLRVLKLARHFEIPAFISVNKWDINLDTTKRIEKSASEAGAIVLERIPYDASITKAQIQGQSVVEYNNGPAATAIKNLWKKLCHHL